MSENVYEFGTSEPVYKFGSHSDFNTWTYGTTTTNCPTCQATVPSSSYAAHMQWHEDLVDEMHRQLQEMAKGLAVEILRELAKQ